MNPLFSPTGELGPKCHAKWTSIRCMFDSLRTLTSPMSKNRHDKRFGLKSEIVGPAPLQKSVGDFYCINFGGFCREFSWRIFLGTPSHKNEDKQIWRLNPPKNTAAQDQKSAKEPFCQQPTPKIGEECRQFRGKIRGKKMLKNSLRNL